MRLNLRIELLYSSRGINMLHPFAVRFVPAFVALFALCVAATVSAPQASGVVNVYSARHYQVDEQVNRLFTERTGIGVRVVNAPANQLIERIKSEGSNSPADVPITVDAGQMQRAREEGLLRPLHSAALKDATPDGLRDPEGYWYPYTVRARVIMVSADRVKPGEITGYSDLADPKWRGRLLIRSSSSPYNQALTAAYLTAHGEDATRAWVRGITRNLARPPQGGDRDQIRFVAAGLADVCVSNTYYLGMMLNSTDAEERRLARLVRVVFPDQHGNGAHVNVSAAGVVRHASNG
jgi:iron(III) transport system substrate-binding protein